MRDKTYKEKQKKTKQYIKKWRKYSRTGEKHGRKYNRWPKIQKIEKTSQSLKKSYTSTPSSVENKNYDIDIKKHYPKKPVCR